MLERLRSETRDLHQRLDHHPLMQQLMNPHITRATYARILEKFLGFYRPLEPIIAAYVPCESKLPWLLADLKAFHVDPDTLPNAPQPQWIRDEASAMGTYYVLEGSTLGGQIIARHLSRTLDLTLDTGLAYFTSYGADVGAHWQATRAALANFAAQHGQEDTVVIAAAQTFQALADWLDRR